MKALGIDIGGTKIASALIDENGEVLTDVDKYPTPKTLDEIYNQLKTIVEKHENDIELVAIATAGAVNRENTKVIGSTGNLPKGYNMLDFQSLSEKRAFIENDANCAAWAEYKIGASKDCDNSVMLTLGTGVGGGIIIDGKLLKGKSGAAGEMHFVMSRKRERSCTCGSFDCYESYASGNGLRKTAAEIFNDDFISTYSVMDMAKKGHPDALRALEIWQNDVALGIVGLVDIFDADWVVLAGSMGEFINTEEVEEYVNKHICTTPTNIYHATAGNYAGMIGAALLAYDNL